MGWHAGLVLTLLTAAVPCAVKQSPSYPRTRRCEWGLLALVPELGNLRDAEMCEGAADVRLSSRRPHPEGMGVATL